MLPNPVTLPVDQEAVKMASNYEGEMDQSSSAGPFHLKFGLGLSLLIDRSIACLSASLIATHMTWLLPRLSGFAQHWGADKHNVGTTYLCR